MNFATCLIKFSIIVMSGILSSESFSKTKLSDWVGTYIQKNEKGGLTIEKEGKRLWIEIWREREPGEVRTRPDDTKYKGVYFVSVHGNTAKRVPFRGELCPSTYELEPGGLKLTDDCSGPRKLYYYRKVK